MRSRYEVTGITAPADSRHWNTAIRRALVLLLWLMIPFGLQNASSAQQPAVAATSPVSPGRPVANASGEAVTLTSNERLWLSQHNGQIRIGVTVIPPQVLFIDGQYQGLSIDYIRLIFRKLDCDFKLVPCDTWNQVMQAAKAHEIDMIFAAQQTPERKEYLLFTQPYIELPNMIIVRKDRQGDADLNAMKGWRVAASQASAVHEFLKSRYPDLKLLPVPDELNGLMKVSLGEADAMVVEISRASYYIEKAGIMNLRVLGPAGLLYRLRFAVRKDWPVLAGILDKGLAMVTDQEQHAISRQWIMVGERRVLGGKTVWMVFLSALTVIVLAVLAMIIWNRMLRKVVRERTQQLQRELSERRQTEIALRASQEKYRCIVDTANEGICVLDSDGRTTFVNSRMAEMLGLTPAELMDRRLADFMFDEDIPDHKSRMEARRRGEHESYERRFRRRNGGILWARVSATPVFDAEGRFQGSFGMITDITNSKQAEQDLHRLNRQLRAISTCNRVLMQATDEQRLLDEICSTICNEAGYRMAWVGYRQSDEAERIRPVTWAGVEDGYLAEAEIILTAGQSGAGLAGKAVKEGVSACVQDFAVESGKEPWRQSALQRGYRSGIGLPLADENRAPFGVLCIYSTQPGIFTLEEMALLDELAGNLAFGISTLRIRQENKKAEMQILASEQLFRALVENSPDFIARYDRQFRRSYVNPAIQKLFGNEAGNVLGQTPADQSPLHAPQIYIEHIRKVIENASESTAEIPFRTARGEMHWGHLRFVPEFGQDGQVASVLAIGRDIHEVKENEQRFRMLAVNFPDFVIRFDRDGYCTYINPAVEKAFDLPPKANARAALSEIARYGRPEQNQGLLALVRQTFDQGVANESDMYWDTRMGQRLFEIRCAPEKDATGNVVSVLGIARDITERKQTERELASYRDNLEELVKERTAELHAAYEELEAFTYSVSHDLRAPLRHIDGFLELLQEKVAATVDEQGRHYMETIADAAVKMGYLIDNLLSFSRMGREAMSCQQVALTPLVQDTIREIEPDTAGRNIAWSIGELPVVCGDADMLRMVMGNLISNAVKFTRHRRQARIEIGVMPDRGVEAVIFVRDNGAGFDMAFAEKLFGVFQRLHHADEFEGTGIGLANVHRIIARHGGRTWAEGKPDQGAVFYFSLPHKPPAGVLEER